MNTYAVILVSVTLAAIGQVAWKLGMNQTGQSTATNFAAVMTVLLNPYILLGFVLYGLGTIFWLIALSKKDLSFVYPFISLTYMLVLILSNVILKESIGINKLVGIMFIITGLFIIARAQ
jgi:multidrug transporter EmrE-like cation transporter